MAILRSSYFLTRKSEQKAWNIKCFGRLRRGEVPQRKDEESSAVCRFNKEKK